MSWNFLRHCGSNISKTSASVSSGFQTRKTFETTRPQAEWLYCFQAFGNLMTHKARVFSWNYFSILHSPFSILLLILILIIFETWNMHDPQKMCMMCMILSPKSNCCAVTIFEFSTTEVMLPSRLSVLSEHVASQSKWQSADLDLLKLAKKRKSVWPPLFRGNVCI